MHDKFLLLMIDFTLSGLSLIFLITVGGIIPLIASSLSIFWFLNLFKKMIEKDHNGSITNWFKWLSRMVKKN